LSGKEVKNSWANKTDSNKDGKVSEKEFLATFEDRFKEVDSNKDGFVTLEELRGKASKAPEEMETSQ